MALVKGNVLLQYVKGTIGNEITIYERNGQIIIAKKRRKSNKKPTQKQKEVRWKMRVASAYAKAILRDPQIKAYYKSMAGPGQNAYNMAVKDAFHSPEIQNLQLAESTVVVSAKNEFRLAEVRVQVLDKDGKTVESGRAVPAKNGIDWEYKIAHLPQKGRIKVAVEDLPGNVSERQLLLE
ncbi:hypothetical protein [Chitinophaga sancti]|uniref:Uncharacterized protein n=1 Tax=Chitinophaga sancti TaxID=1004 RepID=A0A1K1SHT5_9BACT|nr:hypothetical protein [Chitinophaga sancti]WQD61798.1 hypothetical protein U0033_28350 [Chitinophaga sancti]WQG92633.1 hypothetical protein SR876_14035 [Chitinophaga sancti]SFW83921.1 hypothetical protein SAMN05661012_05479 [Chitinophaga sancti]